MRHKNRHDHILPQGYLRGFIDPARKNHPRPLWVIDLAKQKWFEKSSRGFAYEIGYYDYAEGNNPDQTADEDFAELESKFPPVRDKILSEGFSTWPKHKDFLLRFGQMLRVRNELFRKKHQAWTSNAVTALSPADPGKREELQKNWAITDMRMEIKKGAMWFNQFDWALLFTKDPRDPVITSEIPGLVEGSVADLPGAVNNPNPDTLIFIPLCWQMCLIGGRGKFHKETDIFDCADLHRLRALFTTYASKFLVSPTKQRIEG